MAAYAMTELDGKKKDGDDKADDKAPAATGKQAASKETKENTDTEAKSAEIDGSAAHGFGSSPAKETAPNTSATEPTQTHVALTPTKAQEEAQSKQEPDSKNDIAVDTSAPVIEEKLSAEVTPNNADEKNRKRPHSATEEEEAPSSFNPPPRPQSGKSDTKVELFRKPTANNGLPLPERNVSSDSEDVTARKGDEVKEPPAKKVALESTQS